MMQTMKVLRGVFITFLVIDIEIIQGLYLENGNQFGLARPIRGPESCGAAVDDEYDDAFESVIGKNTILSAYIFFSFLHIIYLF